MFIGNILEKFDLLPSREAAIREKSFLYSKMIAGFFIVNKFYRVYLFWTAGPVWRLPSIVSEENSHEQHA
ncbi:hypothetical protein LJR257_004511 [Ensifer adhaerens]